MSSSKKELLRYLLASIPLVINNFLMMGVIGVVTRAIEVNTLVVYRNALLAVICMVAVVSINRYISGRVRIRYSIDYVHSLRSSFFKGILWLPYYSFAKKSKERYLSLLVNDINTIDMRYFSSLSSLSYWLVFMLVAIIVLCIIDIKLLLIIVPAEALIISGSLFLSKRINNLEIQLSNMNGDYTSFVSNLFDGIEITKLAKREEAFSKMSETTILNLEKKKAQYGMYKMIITVGLSSLSLSISLGIILYLCAGIAAGGTVATALLAYQIGSTLCYAANYCATALLTLKSSYALQTHIKNDYLVTLKHARAHKSIESFPGISDVCPIKVNDLSFSFESQEIFKNTSFELEKGKKYLVVGPSGCGKTTLLNLLSGIFHDYSGSIKSNGVELREIEPQAYLQKISIVYQDTFLFSDTVRNNLTLFQADYDDNRINEIVAACRLDAIIDALPGKLDAYLDDNGSRLSGGERQRFSIARAMLKKATLLLADEPTASLDEQTAISVEKALLGLPGTIVVVSHRIHPDLITKYDYILQVCNKNISIVPSQEYF